MRFIKYFLSTLLIGVSAHAASIQPAAAVPSTTVGGRTFTDLTNLKILFCISGASSNCTFRAQGQSSGYQVTTGKTLTIYAIYASSAVSSGQSIDFQLLQSDNDVGQPSSTSFTNPVYINGTTSDLFQSSVTAGVPMVNAISFSIASQKYLSVKSGITAQSFSYIAYGYEQ